MFEIVIASKNKGKIREIKEVLSLPDVVFHSCEDFNDWPSVSETGSTYKENASIKARTLARWTQKPALADDSGLEVDALGGAPGIRSARYAESGHSSSSNIQKLLSELGDTSPGKRTARFKCSVVFFNPIQDITLAADGVCEGQISFKPSGTGGFGYDPVFIPSGYKKTLAELPAETKNKLSHRGQALRKLRKLLVNQFNL
jgi:XTP/dITP diphosphohydrolase